MLKPDVDGRLQVCAGQALLEISGLVSWRTDTHEFVPIGRSSFQSSWKKFDPVFGRLSCWINFSAGAEFLLKGVCLVNELDFRKKKKGTIDVPTYGTLGDLTKEKNGRSKLLELCKKTDATADEEALLVKGYKRLQHEIRNRDAHAYVANVRDSHHHLVRESFTRCFNLLASWLPNGSGDLTQWKLESKELVDSQ